MGMYDDTIKSLVGKDPQALVSFVAEGAIYLGDVERELKARTVHADALYYVLWHEEEMVLHVEFQVSDPLTMPRRVWKYNALADITTDKPVYSVVLYLVPQPAIPESFYQRNLADGQWTQACAFRQIKLWEVPAETFEQPELENLLPLLPLTKDGQNYRTVERMIRDLKAGGKQELLWLGEALAGLVLTSAADKRWIKERFHPMLHEILKQSWVYQEAVQETRQEALREGEQVGLQKGEQQGEQKGIAEGIARFVELRFPNLLPQTQEVLACTTTVEQLQDIQTKLYLANTLEEAQAALQ